MTQTYIEPEEYAYTLRGSQVRKALCRFDDGKLRRAYGGVPDTYFTIPAHARVAGKYVKGYIYSEDGELRFRASMPEATR
jgi:hypothetical protein